MVKYAILFIGILLMSCMVSTTSTKLQDAMINGPANKSTIKITDPNHQKKTIVRSTISAATIDEYKTNTGTHTKVDSHGDYVLNNHGLYYSEPSGVNIYEFQGENLIWQFPKSRLNIEIESTQREYAFLFGFNYSRDNSTNFFGGHGGVAYLLNYKYLACRFDFSVQFASMVYDVDFIENETNVKLCVWDCVDPFVYTKKIIKYTKRGQETYWSPEISITLNTNKTDWPINYFVNYSTSSQKLFDITRNGESFAYTTNSDFFSIGVFKSITPKKRIVVGSRYNKYQNGGPGYMDFLVQFDLFDIF